MNITGKVALVTGGSKGIGRAIALAYGKAGIGVALTYLSDQAAAHEVVGVVGPHYAASKAGMLGLMHSYAALLAKSGVTANAIAPALIETGMLANNPNIKKDLIPVGRFGATEEVADTALLLASNGYITGQTINVNGGWYMS